MKLLLTSNGLSNDSIANALEELVGKPRKEIKVAFIPTAAFSQDDDKHESRDWLINDLHRINKFAGFVDIVSLADLETTQILERLSYVDVIFVGGGNSFYLSYYMQKSGVMDVLPGLLKTRVYAGISAGSMIVGANLRTSSQALAKGDLRDDEYNELGPRGKSSAKTAGLVPFVIRPHLNSRFFPNITGELVQKVADQLDVPIYAIDDQTAIKVVDGEVEVVSEGTWKLYE